MADKPGLSTTDEQRAGQIVRLVEAALNLDTPDVRAGLGAVMRELRSTDPEAVQRLATALRLRGVGRNLSTPH